MKYIFFISLLSLLFASCSKEQTPLPFINSDCPDTISFQAKILPMITTNCNSCHDGSNQSLLSNYGNIEPKAESILKSLKGDGMTQMPYQSPALHDSLIQQFECWISQGKLNN